MGTSSIYTLLSLHGIALILGYYAGLTIKPGVNHFPENRICGVVMLLFAMMLSLGTTAFFVGFVAGNRVAEEDEEDLEADRLSNFLVELKKVKDNGNP